MDRRAREARLGLFASRQGGAFTFLQALAVGYSRGAISRHLSRGEWVRIRPGVYRMAGTPESRSLDLWAAVLACGDGCTITHETAAVLHGAERLRSASITLTNPHGRHHRLDGVVVHQIDDLAERHRTTHRGLPISTPSRVVVELGATQSVEMIGLVADDLINERRTSLAAIASVLAEVTRPGKPGLDKVMQVLEERGDGYVPPASELERSLFSALAAGGLPEPVRQLPLPGRGPTSGIADGGYLDAKIVLEADGRRWHARMKAARVDRERDARVVQAGWVPLRFVYEQIAYEPAVVCEIVNETRAMRLAQLSRAA